MGNEVETFISRLRSPSVEAKNLGISVQAVYKRMRTGYYKIVNISGINFIIK